MGIDLRQLLSQARRSRSPQAFTAKLARWFFAFDWIDGDGTIVVDRLPDGVKLRYQGAGGGGGLLLDEHVKADSADPSAGPLDLKAGAADGSDPESITVDTTRHKLCLVGDYLTAPGSAQGGDWYGGAPGTGARGYQARVQRDVITALAVDHEGKVTSVAVRKLWVLHDAGAGDAGGSDSGADGGGTDTTPDEQVATPTITPAGGEHGSPCSVTVESATAGATLWTSTDDGLTWTEQGVTPVTFALTIPADGVTLTAKATKAGMLPSARASAAFTLATGPTPFTWYLTRREQVVDGSWVEVETYSYGTDYGSAAAYHLNYAGATGEHGLVTHWRYDLTGSGTLSFSAQASWSDSTGYPYCAIYLYHRNADDEVLHTWATGEHTNGTYGHTFTDLAFNDGDYLEVVLQTYTHDGTVTNLLEIFAP